MSDFADEIAEIIAASNSDGASPEDQRELWRQAAIQVIAAVNNGGSIEDGECPFCGLDLSEAEAIGSYVPRGKAG